MKNMKIGVMIEMQYKMKGHHVVARVPMGKRIHQAVLVCDETDRYKERILIEEAGEVFPMIYTLKLARELADIFNGIKTPSKWSLESKWNLNNYVACIHAFIY